MPPADVRLRLERAGYRLVGEHKHSAVKVCHWTKKSLLDRGVCYKEQFYSGDLGVRSHQCLQFTPSLPFCDHRCVFCWRDTSLTSSSWFGEADDPEDIITEALAAQRLLLSGFGGNPDVNRRKFEEAQNPRHCAISLAGEPTMYPKIGDLIDECHKRGMTSFLVTNGQHPDVLERLPDPTQLYISLVAPDSDTYEKTCRPVRPGGWERLSKSLDLMSSFSCRKVIRLTLVKGLNLKDPVGYARMIRRTDADFVELKAYMFVGFSRKRLKMENMPSHSEIKTFAEELARELGFSVAGESEQSRAVLLRA